MMQKQQQSPISADVHMHTCHSHGEADVLAMFEAARRKGLTTIGFSEHSPRPAGYAYKDDYQEKLNATFPDYIREVLALKEKVQNSGVLVLLGLEVDFIPAEEAFSRTLCAAYPYDYIIGGLHFQGTWGFDGPEADWLPLSQDKRFLVYRQYYQDLASMCRTNLFNIAAHPDLIKIHTITDFNTWLDTPAAQESILIFLHALQAAGMAMEVSSAGLRKNCKEIYPGPRIMELAAKMGIPISFGADAHCTETPAFAFDSLARYAGSFGYTEHVIFEEKHPRLLSFSRPDSLSCHTLQTS